MEISIDIDATQDYYKKFCSEGNECDDNINISDILTLEQKYFFEKFGIDLSKVMIKHCSIPENEEESLFSEIYMIRAIICGDLCGIPKYHEEFYFGAYDNDDEPLFPICDELNINVSDEGDLFEEICGMLISFSHPLPFFALKDEEKVDEKYKQWFCGECFIKAIIKK